MIIQDKMINLEKQSEQEYKVFFNKKLLGYFRLEVDGFFYFTQVKNSWGYWSSNNLKAIADKLDEVNKPYKENVDEYFDQERRDREERARVEYRKLLNESGFFFEWYPNLTGDWKKDKLEWFIIHADLEDLRAKKDVF